MSHTSIYDLFEGTNNSLEVVVSPSGKVALRMYDVSVAKDVITDDSVVGSVVSDVVGSKKTPF